MKRIGCLLTAFCLLAAFSACSTEPRSTTIHKPGEYKGAKDPLLKQQNQQDLIDRFKLVQTDR